MTDVDERFFNGDTPPSNHRFTKIRFFVHDLSFYGLPSKIQTSFRQVIGSSGLAGVQKQTEERENFHQEFRLANFPSETIFKSVKVGFFFLASFTLCCIGLVHIQCLAPGRKSYSLLLVGIVLLLVAGWLFAVGYDLVTDDFNVLTYEVQRRENGTNVCMDFLSGGDEISSNVAHI